jgi:tetratricopeptide (TPR) repeat protein
MNQSEILSSSPRLPAHRPISPTPAVIPSANSTKQDVKPALRPRGQNIDLINPSTDDQQPNLMLTTLNEQEAKLFKLGLELGDSVGNVSTRETSIHSGVLNDSKLMDSKLAPVRQYSTTEKERLGEFEDGKLRLADTYHQSGEMQKARALYVECRIMMSRTLIDMQTERIIRIDCRIAELCLHEGKYVEAQAGFEALEKRALANYPPKGLRCWEIGRWMGIVHDKQGKYKAAQEKLSSINQAMEDTEWHDDDTKDEFEANVLMTKNALSLTCGHAGDFVQAIAINDKALALAENSGRTFRMSPIQLNRAAIYAYHERYKEAEDQNVKALNNMEKHLGPNHVKTLDCRSLEAHLLAVDGQLKEAEERCQATLKRMRETLGKDHPGTLQALGTLVLVYKAKGRLADALQTALRLVDSCKTSPALGRNHPQTIRANRALASVYSARGELYQAIELQKEVVDVSAATESGPNHPTALSYRSDLANMYCQNEEWETANDMAYEVFVKQCRNFVSEFEPGEKAQKADILAKSDEARVALRVLLDQLCEHLNQNRHVRCPMSLLSTMDCLGISERDKENGNLELARTILAHVTSYRQGMLAAHPDTLSSQFELAKTKRLAGDLEAAAEDFQAVLFGRLKVLGDDHPDTLTARHELNVTWFQLGEHEEATWELEMTLKVRKNLLGETHPDIIRSEVQIASLYHSVGRLGKAEALLFAALNSQLQIYGLHRLDNKTLDGRSLWYREALQPIEKQLQVLEGWNRPSGISKLTGEPKYYPDVVSSLASLASIYVDRGDAADLDKAVAIQSAVVSLQENSLSPDALITLQSINDFALTLQARGTLEGNTSQQDMDQAKAMYERIIKANPVSDTLLLKCKSNLASLFFACNELPQAEQTLTEVLDSYRDPNVDPEAILASMFNLALTKKELNKADEALQLMQAVVERTRYALGAKHPQSIQMAQTLEEWREEIDLESKEEQGMSGKGTKVEEMDKASLLGESKHSTEAGHSDHR